MADKTPYAKLLEAEDAYLEATGWVRTKFFDGDPAWSEAHDLNTRFERGHALLIQRKRDSE